MSGGLQWRNTPQVINEPGAKVYVSLSTMDIRLEISPFNYWLCKLSYEDVTCVVYPFSNKYFGNLSTMKCLFMGIIAGWYLGLYKWTDVESPSCFFLSDESKISPRGPIFLKRQNNTTKRPTTEKNIVRRAIQAIISFCKRKKITVGKERGRKGLTLLRKWLFQLCFGDGNATILGRPCSSLPRCFSADKRDTAPHCHSGREEEKYNPDSRKELLWSEKKWHIISLLFTWWMI